MDKSIFEKEILALTEPNYVQGVFDMVNADRNTVLKSLIQSSKVLETRVDFLYLCSFASILRHSAPTAAVDAVNDLSPDLSSNTARWFDRSQVLINQIQNMRNHAVNTGILHSSLAYLARR